MTYVIIIIIIIITKFLQCTNSSMLESGGAGVAGWGNGLATEGK